MGVSVCPAIKWGAILSGAAIFFNRGLTGVIQWGYTYVTPKGKLKTTISNDTTWEVLKKALDFFVSSVGGKRK